MKILSIRLHPFAATNDRTTDLRDGLNVVEGPNEFGKSTLTQALWHSLHTPSNLTPKRLSVLATYYLAESSRTEREKVLADELKFDAVTSGISKIQGELAADAEFVKQGLIARNLLLRVAPETAVGPDRRAGKRGFRMDSYKNEKWAADEAARPFSESRK